MGTVVPTPCTRKYVIIDNELGDIKLRASLMCTLEWGNARRPGHVTINTQIIQSAQGSGTELYIAQFVVDDD